jgi:hypothetical protein
VDVWVSNSPIEADRHWDGEGSGRGVLLHSRNAHTDRRRRVQIARGIGGTATWLAVACLMCSWPSPRPRCRPSWWSDGCCSSCAVTRSTVLHCTASCWAFHCCYGCGDPPDEFAIATPVGDALPARSASGLSDQSYTCLYTARLPVTDRLRRMNTGGW